MVSHWAGDIFDYNWEREDVCVEDKKLAVIDENGVGEDFLQVKKYLIAIIVWSYSSINA